MRICKVAVNIRVSGNLRGYTIIAGFPGIGVVGPIVAKHIVESQGLKVIGSITSDKFPAVSAISNGVAESPVRIYADPKRKIAVILSEIMFKEDSAKELGTELINLAKKAGIKKIISIAGVLIPNREDNGIYGVVSDEKLLNTLDEYGIAPVPKGVTTGISASLLVNGKAQNIPVLLLLGTLHAKEDFRAAAEIIKTLDQMLGLDVDYDSLLDQAKKIEREVSSVMQHSKSASSMYG